MANTREVTGEQACLDALVANTLTSFEDDGVTKVGASCLRYHTALTDVTLSQCRSVESYGLADCTNLEVVDMLGNGTIAANAFSGDIKLAHLLLRGASKTTLSATSAFTSTPIRVSEGAVYVPQDLVATYKADSNWGGYLILPLSEYPKTGLPETVSDSWSDIIASSANGTYDSKYTVGDVKSMSINGTTYYFMLAAKDADVLASDGTTTVPMTWLMFKKLYGATYYMNSTNTSSGGWEASAMRSWLSGTVLQLMPSEVQAAIKEVRKYSDTYESAIVHDQATADKLWIPSAREVFGGTSYEQTGPTYSSLFPDQSSRVKYAYSGSPSTWWLRSASSATLFRAVNDYGNMDTYGAKSTRVVVLGFCI